MLKKIKLGLVALLLPLLAFGQSYPSPTFQNLTVNGTLSVTGAPTFTSPVPVASGGTGKTSISANALLYGAGTAALNTLGPLTNGQLVIGSTGAAPVAAALTGTANQIVVTNGAGSITLSTPQNIDSTATPTFAGLTLSSPLTVANGGSGRATLTSHAALIGAGTSAVTQVAPSTAGQALISAGATSDPIWGYPTGTLIGVQRFTSSGTYTPTSGTASIIVEVIGGGGGGGGAAATAAGQVAPAAGGAAGSYSRSRITSGFSGVTVTVGAAGAGGTAGANAGTAGGTSSFGALVIAPGGSGANGAAASSPPIALWTANSAAQASGGTLINSAGHPGSFGIAMSTGDTLSGSGGPSVFGGGGSGVTTTNAGGTAPSAGGGGGGACSTNGGGAQAGGSGGPGVVIVYEYN